MGDYHEKNTENLICSRQKKPFLDHNLQMQIPEIKPSFDSHASCSHTIYSHYSSSSTTTNKDPISIYEDEINQSMNEAEQAQKAWKAMQAKLLDATKLFLNKK